MYPVKVYSASTAIQEYELAPQVSLYDDTYRVSLTRLGKRIRIAGCAELGSSSFDLHQKAINTLVKVGDDWDSMTPLTREDAVLAELGEAPAEVATA